MQIAPSGAAAQRRSAFAFKAQDLTVLSTGGDIEFSLAGDGGNFDDTAIGGDGKVHRNFAIQIAAVTFKNRAGPDVKHKVKVARRTAVQTGAALPRVAQLGTGIDTGGNADSQRAFDLNLTAAAAFITGFFNDFPAAIAVGTGLPDTEKSLRNGVTAGAVAARAGLFTAAGSTAGTCPCA